MTDRNEKEKVDPFPSGTKIGLEIWLLGVVFSPVFLVGMLFLERLPREELPELRFCAETLVCQTEATLNRLGEIPGLQVRVEESDGKELKIVHLKSVSFEDLSRQVVRHGLCIDDRRILHSLNCPLLRESARGVGRYL